MFIIEVGPNVQVTNDGPANSRSESSLAIDPSNPQRLLGASKKFTDPTTYSFTVAGTISEDGGATWHDLPALEIPNGGTELTDPWVAFDGQGGGYIFAIALEPLPPGEQGPADHPIVGMVSYRTVDGATWSAPDLFYVSPDSDRLGAAGDTSPTSPHHGNVYVGWDDTPDPGGAGWALAFARSTDSGQSWIGVGAQLVGTRLAENTFEPDLTVSPDGTLYVVWVDQQDTTVKCLASSDGGDSFGAPITIAPVTLLPTTLPGGTFRVFTYPTVCAGPNGTVVVAWADYRDGTSKIYYRSSTDHGASWSGPDSGQLLSAGLDLNAALHDFHPQLACDANGYIGCAFYEFGATPPSGTNLINVMMAFSFDNGTAFADSRTVTDQPWDPAKDAPDAPGDVTFIGDYFGLAASDQSFYPFWTDTRTDVQELLTAKVTVRWGYPILNRFAGLEAKVVGLGAALRRRNQPLGDLRAATERLRHLLSDLARLVGQRREDDR